MTCKSAGRLLQYFSRHLQKVSEMKQVVLAVIAFLVFLSIYAVYLGLEEGITNSNAVTKTASDVNASTALTQTETTKKSMPVVKKKPYKAPASTAKSKRLFLKNTIAAIKSVKKRLDAQYDMVYALSQKEQLTPKEQTTVDALKKRYKVKGIPCLLKRLHTHPISIVIAQAALETGWGSSRFYREANNIFGIWSFNKNEPRMAAGVKREGVKTIYVKKYKNLEASIEGYYRMMAMGRAYKAFRNVRLLTDNPFEIIPFLDHYSELRHEYVKRLYFVIKSNKFYELDDPQYQPPGWRNIKVADPKYLLEKKHKPAAKIADKCKKDEVEALIPKNPDVNSSHSENIKLIEETNRSAPVQELDNANDSILKEHNASKIKSADDFNKTSSTSISAKEINNTI